MRTAPGSTFAMRHPCPANSRSCPRPVTARRPRLDIRDGTRRCRARGLNVSRSAGSKATLGDARRRWASSSTRATEATRGAADDLRRPGGRLAGSSRSIAEVRGIEFAPIDFESRATRRPGARRPGKFKRGEALTADHAARPARADDQPARLGDRTWPNVVATWGVARGRPRRRDGLQVEPQRAIEQAHPVRLERTGLIAARVAMTPREDSPRGAVPRSVLARQRRRRRRARRLVAARLVSHGRSDAHSMRAMVMGLGQIGARAQGEMGAAIFLAMWVTMMAAMMLPTVAPIVLAHLADRAQAAATARATRSCSSRVPRRLVGDRHGTDPDGAFGRHSEVARPQRVRRQPAERVRLPPTSRAAPIAGAMWRLSAARIRRSSPPIAKGRSELVRRTSTQHVRPDVLRPGERVLAFERGRPRRQPARARHGQRTSSCPGRTGAPSRRARRPCR